MYSSRLRLNSKALRKGEFLKLESIYSVPLLHESVKGRFCGNCLKCLKRSRDEEPLLPCLRFACPGGCGERFCSDNCSKAAIHGQGLHTSERLGWHCFLCPGEHLTLTCTMLEFSKYCSHSSETFMLAARVFARILSLALTSHSNLTQFVMHFQRQFTTSHRWSEIAARASLDPCVEYSAFVHHVNLFEEQLGEAWSLLRAHFINVCHFKHIILDDVLKLEIYADFASNVEQKAFAVDKVERQHNSHISSKGVHDFNVLSVVKQKLPCVDILVEREALKLANIDDTKVGTISGLFGLALCSGFNQLLHSCVPNVQVEPESSSFAELGCVTLRNLNPEHELTVASVPLHHSVKMRESKLIQRLGLICACPRCLWERGNMVSLSSDDISSLATQAQEEGRFEDTQRLLKYLLRQQPRDADTLHSFGVSLLSQGNWKAAHDVWRCAYVLNKEHYWLTKQAIKDSAYVSFQCGTPTVSSTPYHTIETGQIYLTARKSLSQNKCARWIHAAENVAKVRGGWETDRHKAVPTTDLPVHEIPIILKDWNALFMRAIGPFIKDRFEVASDNVIHVHDAFAVKYDAALGQNYLPVHTDQGHFSLTLALNDAAEYVGGGTVFPGFAVNVNPGCGDFVAFKSSIPHGGTPISYGVRYIVVAFLYID